MKKVLIHIPHSSYYIPQRYRRLFYLSGEELFQEQLRMTDSYTDQIYAVKGTERLIFPFSRLICDVERFRNEKDEEMTKQGMWICYTRTSDGKPLKEISNCHKQDILHLYDNHHAFLEKWVEKTAEEIGNCLIIDAHSFSSVPLPYELHSQEFRPNICIGTDLFHTPDYLIDYFYNAFNQAGYSVGINTPFQGTIVPLRYYHQNKRVMSIMIELNRSLYMNENTGKKKNEFGELKNNISRIIRNIPMNKKVRT